jgi:hypothetical protein
MGKFAQAESPLAKTLTIKIFFITAPSITERYLGPGWQRFNVRKRVSLLSQTHEYVF